METYDIVFDGESQSNLGRIVLAGILSKNERLPKPIMRLLGCYALVYITEGQGHFQDAQGFRYRVKKGDLLFLYPEIGHTYGPGKGEIWNEIYIVFEGPVFDLWYRQGLFNPQRPVIHLEPVDYWFKQLKNTIWSVPQSGPSYSLVRLCQFQKILSNIFLYEKNQTIGKVDDVWLGQAKILLEKNINRKLDYEKIAFELGMSYESFRKKFCKMAGVSPGKYRTRRLMDRACEILTTGDSTLRSIAIQLGFCDEFYFSRRFKQITGLSPRDFKKALSL